MLAALYSMRFSRFTSVTIEPWQCSHMLSNINICLSLFACYTI